MANHTGPIIGKSAGVRATTLYVHGLFMTGAEGFVLLRRLRNHGVACRRFCYESRRESPDDTVERLASRLAADPALNLVGHSLGGVISAVAVAKSPGWRGRAVLLGPPLAGSDTARRAAQLPGGRWLLGRGGRYLAGAPEAVAGSSRVLVIAGVRNVGIGRLIGACASPGDGQVRLAETALSGAMHDDVRRGHLALVFDRRVARMTADFLLA
ncbi:MAG: esterase/lipase family protein [Gammaproteobacteria bacterium]